MPVFPPSISDRVLERTASVEMDGNFADGEPNTASVTHQPMF